MIYRASIITPLSDCRMAWYPDAYLAVNEDGVIESISTTPPADANVVDYSGKIILPGLIDAHSHVAQYAFAGTGNLALLEWLNQYAFPQEERFLNPRVAEAESQKFFEDAKATGTTTIAAYAMSSSDATNRAFKIADKSGMRVFMGQVLMDRNAPESLIVPIERALFETLQLVRRWHGKNRLKYILTPRFAITSTTKLLEETGKLAAALGLPVQTHLAENKSEIRETLSLFPEASSYTDLYNRYGLLTSKTIFAHGIYLSKEELQSIAAASASIAHCPSSNRFLGSGVFPFSQAQAQGVNVALGTDVAAGYTLSMLHEIKESMETSKTAELFSIANRISAETALCAATLGGAKALGIESITGSLEQGKQADFIFVDDSSLHPVPSSAEYNSLPQRLSRILYRGRPEMILKTFVSGEEIFSRENHDS